MLEHKHPQKELCRQTAPGVIDLSPTDFMRRKNNIENRSSMVKLCQAQTKLSEVASFDAESPDSALISAKGRRLAAGFQLTLIFFARPVDDCIDALSQTPKLPQLPAFLDCFLLVVFALHQPVVPSICVHKGFEVIGIRTFHQDLRITTGARIRVAACTSKHDKERQVQNKSE